MAVASPSPLNLSMSRIFLAGHRCPASTNPKSEIRNPKQPPNPNEKFSKPTQSARPQRLGFADLLLCSLECVADFGFRISHFGFCPPFLPNRRCPAKEDVGKDQRLNGERGEAVKGSLITHAGTAASFMTQS